MDDSAVSFGLLVIVLLLILWLIRRRRAHRYLLSDSEAARVPSAGRRSVFQDSVPGDSQGSQPVVPTVVEDSIGAGFVTELETQRGVAVTSDEVDPLTEAEIYIAYGRASQAEKILRDAINRFPSRVELKLKLLEALQTLDKSVEFDELMTGLIQEVDKDSAEFAHLQALSKKIKAGGDPISETPGNPVAVDSLSPLEIASAAVEEGSSRPQSPKMDLQEIEFEIESVSEIRDSALVPAQSRTGSDDAGLESGEGDFSFEIDSDVEPDEVISFEPFGEESKHSDEDLDSLVLIDETETSDQLDLAQACIQIGDEEGARRILQTLIDGEDKESAEKAVQILKTL
jgi:pilus assembly protein FimV